MRTFCSVIILSSLLSSASFAKGLSNEKFFALIETAELSEIKSEVSKNPKLVSAKNTNNQTALTIAAESGLDQIALYLMEKGAETEGSFGASQEPLSFFAVRGNSVVLLEKLLEKNPKILNEKNKAGESLLFEAVRTGSPAMTRLLAKKGLSANEKNSAGTTAKDLAKKMNYSSILKLLD